MAAQIHSQLGTGAPAALSFDAVTLNELQVRWLRHHEQVLRLSVQTINRYRTATRHLLNFVAKARVLRTTSHFRPPHAEEFVHHLRTIEVAPNGHANSEKRLALSRYLWSDAGAVQSDRLRTEFLRITQAIRQPHQTAPTVFRNLFATSLQDANVDSLIRCELMGHSTGASSASGNGATSGFQLLAKMSDPFEKLSDIRKAATVRRLASGV